MCDKHTDFKPCVDKSVWISSINGSYWVKADCEDGQDQARVVQLALNSTSAGSKSP